MNRAKQTKKWHLPQRTVAAPSWVVAGSIWENCCILEALADEVGLLFFELEACMRGENSVPKELASLALSYHVHLPLDLPMTNPLLSVRYILALLKGLRHLSLTRLVIHPPVYNGRKFLEHFLPLCQEYSIPPLAWENIGECDLLEYADLFLLHKQGICLDLGHLLAYKQEALLEMVDILEQVTIFHINAPGPLEQKNRHFPLPFLHDKELGILQECLKKIPQDAVLMLELFQLEHIEISYPILCDCFFEVFPFLREKKE